MSDHLFQQITTFHEVTLPCDRCERNTPLWYLQPCANLGVGFVCKLCLQSMPLAEFALVRGTEENTG